MNLKQLLKTPLKALGLSLCLGASIPLMAATLTIVSGYAKREGDNRFQGSPSC